MNEDTTFTTEETAPAKGTWQAALAQSAVLFDRSTAGRKRASELLWKGAQEGIEAWDSDNDVSGEALYSEVLGLLGKPRKGDASKIRTVALAAKNNGLVVTIYPNLSKAYAEALRLTKTIATQQAEDSAADAAVAALASVIGATASTPEDAAKVVLAKGVDEAARLLLDALGATNEAAHRSLMRAIAQEIAGRVKPAPKPKVTAGPKAGATQAGTPTSKAKAVINTAGAKEKPAPAGAPVKAKAAPVVKPKPVVAEVGTNGVTETGVSTPAVPVKTKAAPVVRRPLVKKG